MPIHACAQHALTIGHRDVRKAAADHGESGAASHLLADEVVRRAQVDKGVDTSQRHTCMVLLVWTSLIAWSNSCGAIVSESSGAVSLSSSATARSNKNRRWHTWLL